MGMLPVKMGMLASCIIGVVMAQEAIYPTMPVEAIVPRTSPVVGSRPSERLGREHKQITLTTSAALSTMYTVTSGKVFWVTSWILSAFNTSTTNSGTLAIRDYGNTVGVMAFKLPTAGAGANKVQESLVVSGQTLVEPLKFAQDVTVQAGAGTITYSLSMVGYEE